MAKGGLPYRVAHAGEKVKQINGVSTLTYLKISTEMEKERNEERWEKREKKSIEARSNSSANKG